MAEHTKQPSGFSGRTSDVVAVTCDHCGTRLDVLCHVARDTGSSASYSVRCPNHACGTLLEVELPAPPIAVLPRP